MSIVKEPRSFQTLRSISNASFEQTKPPAAPRNRLPDRDANDSPVRRASNGEPLYMLIS